MKRLLVIFFLFSTVFVEAQSIQPRPNPPLAVNDFGKMLEPFQVEALEKKLEAYNDSTSSAIVIITVADLQGYDIAVVALQYLRTWGIGTKDKNNGVVLLVSKTDRKARIETGYGMEGVLPDITAKHIIDEQVIPAFKENDYYRGFDQAVDAIILAARGEYTTDVKKNSHSPAISFKTIFFLIIIIIFILSRIGGGGGGNYIIRKGSSGLGGLGWFFLGNMLGGGGSRGGWGGGSGGFGGGGGGGFGGFGGGGGGGGGASGGW